MASMLSSYRDRCGTRARVRACRLAAVLGILTFGLGHSSSSGANAFPPPDPLAVAASDSGGLGPNDIHAAYSLPDAGVARQTIAVVGAYDDPAVASDLKTYLSSFGLSPCTSSHGCFRKVNQQGNPGPLPGPDPTGGTWNTEAALGTEVARGVCQSCSILLVEADAADKSDISAAVATAARLGAQVVEVSSSPPEQPGDASAYGADYAHPGTVVVAATGDDGYTGGITFPAALPGVIAVGGTHLSLDAHGRYASETAWNAGGSGCSLYTPGPAWQAALAASVGCGSKRAVADIAAVADPGALVFITGAPGTPGGAWYEAGGTSLSAPIVAGAIGLAGGGGGSAAQRLYERARSEPEVFHDVTSGSTQGCSGQPICAARRGYDGPTGLGTPNGLAAFLPSGGAIDPRHPDVVASAPRGRINVSAHWIAHLALQNHNLFAVNASVTLRSARRLRIGGRLQTVTFAVAHVTLGAVATDTVSLDIARRYHGLLVPLHKLAVVVKLGLRGVSGRSVTVSQRFRLYAP
jgi:Subtilase family